MDLLVPPPEGFIVLKLLAFTDRRSPLDLVDLGYVLLRCTFDAGEALADAELMMAFEDGSLDFGDADVWHVGRRLVGTFSPPVVTQTESALKALMSEQPHLRVRLLDGSPTRPEPDDLAARVDRVIDTLRRAISAPRR